MMNPAHLDLFRAVVRHGGMSRAAQALGIGQPHVSRAIAQLEADIGFALFVRGHGAALPTREGAAFAREVERSFVGLDRLRDTARQIREVGAGPLRIACQPSLAAALVPAAIGRLQSERPETRVSLLVESADAIWSWASSGQCDIGLARPRAGSTAVTSEHFLTVHAVCAMPRGHRLCRRGSVTLNDLVGERLIAGTGTVQETVVAAFAAAGLEPTFHITGQFTVARCGLVAQGLGLAIVDPTLARALTGLPIVLRPLKPAFPIETMLIRPTGGSPAVLTAPFVAALCAERDAMLAKRWRSSLPLSRRQAS